MKGGMMSEHKTAAFQVGGYPDTADNQVRRYR